MNPFGTGLARITHDPTSSDTNPVWSLDGRRAAYHRDNNEIFVIQADGTGAVNLTKNSAIDGAPTVSDPS